MEKYSFLNAAHTDYFTELYDKYLKHPDTVEPSWRAFFQGFDFGLENGSVMRPTSDIEIPDHLKKEFAVVKLIDAYRTRGHLFTKTNPVRERRTYSPDLNFLNFGLEEEDLSTVFSAGEVMGIGPSTLEKIIIHLKEIYCDSIGVEYMYIRRPEKIDWIQKRLNSNNNHPNFTGDQKKHILLKLNEAVSFENFLHSKFVGQKRFSLEGGESLIPALDSIIDLAAEKGVEEFVMGMSHRGRLNTLVNIFGKSAKDIFNEFEGKDYSEEILFDGDVKYHLGWTCQRKTDSGKKINLNIAPNPSHLETVGAIVQGITRAKQNDDFSGDSSKVIPIIVHGDAAIAGQGLPYEIVQMAGLKGYKTGGTIHIIVNNQIGFTTNYLDARTSTYCTDVGKVTLCPIFHVNSDDVEAVVHASIFALEYRMRFNQDVFIDLLGYRKYGHNEGDEPRFTQPKLYKAIEKHKNSREIYSEVLLNEGLVNQEYLNKIKIDYKEKLEKAYEETSKSIETTITDFMVDKWKGYIKADKKVLKNEIKTKVSNSNLELIAKTISSLPRDKKFLRKIERLINDRKSMFFEKDKIDWAMAEMLAFGSILIQGYNIRISGQDVERGTFSHRHAILKSEESEEEIVLLDNIDSETKGTFNIYNSLLSEYGVLGFDYGYAMASPKTLTIWEAQFGDFSNGAQIIIDQYISASEDKWKLQNGIVLFLPHGYEGQGAEHSSARIERYLQLCAKDNMIIANCTTPANLFHLLRRQILANYRKPLIVFTPKSLLRHPLVVSKKEDFIKGKFQLLIPDKEVLPEKARTLVFCSGKFYYDLIKAREEKNRKDIAIVRIEQIFPLPIDQINNQLNLYNKTKDIVWAQEEPKNMGPFSYLLLHFKKMSIFRLASRPFSDATASGSSKRSEKRHKKVIEAVFKKN
jgi:2-oxoglutarate dehydrogenase E1 component